MKEYCYLTRNTDTVYIRLWPPGIGFRKFRDCCQYGAAWSKTYCTGYLYPKKPGFVLTLSPDECRKRFGFYPKAGEAWDIDGKKRTKIELAFSP